MQQYRCGYLAVRLGIYAEADDAPGGVVIAMVIALGSLALGAWIALRARNVPPK